MTFSDTHAHAQPLASLPINAPNNTPTNQPKHFWQKPGCTNSIGETALGLTITGGAVAAAWILGPETLSVAGEIVTEASAESGPLGGLIEGAHIGAPLLGATLTTAAVPLLLTADGVKGIAGNCFGS